MWTWCMSDECLTQAHIWVMSGPSEDVACTYAAGRGPLAMGSTAWALRYSQVIFRRLLRSLRAEIAVYMFKARPGLLSLLTKLCPPRPNSIRSSSYTHILDILPFLQYTFPQSSISAFTEVLQPGWLTLGPISFLGSCSVYAHARMLCAGPNMDRGSRLCRYKRRHWHHGAINGTNAQICERAAVPP